MRFTEFSSARSLFRNARPAVLLTTSEAQCLKEVKTSPKSYTLHFDCCEDSDSIRVSLCLVLLPCGIECAWEGITSILEEVLLNNEVYCGKCSILACVIGI